MLNSRHPAQILFPEGELSRPLDLKWLRPGCPFDRYWSITNKMSPIARNILHFLFATPLTFVTLYGISLDRSSDVGYNVTNANQI